MRPGIPDRARRFASELAVITIGVLLALGADAANEVRVERSRERRLLADLLTEFRENESTLVSDIRATERGRAAIGEWRGIVENSLPVSPDSTRSLVVAILGTNRFDPRTGALRSLIDGGDLSIVRNLDLRRALAGWGDMVREHQSTYGSLIDARAALMPLLVQDAASVPAYGLLVLENRVGAMAEQQAALQAPLRQVIELLEAEVR